MSEIFQRVLSRKPHAVKHSLKSLPLRVVLRTWMCLWTGVLTSIANCLLQEGEKKKQTSAIIREAFKMRHLPGSQRIAYRERENSMSFLYTSIICRHVLNGFAIDIIAIHIFKCFLSLALSLSGLLHAIITIRWSSRLAFFYNTKIFHPLSNFTVFRKQNS